MSTLLISAHQPAVAGTSAARMAAKRRSTCGLAIESLLILNRVYGQGEYVSIERHVRFGSKADMCSAQADVRLVPIADIAPLFDHFVGATD